MAETANSMEGPMGLVWLFGGLIFKAVTLTTAAAIVISLWLYNPDFLIWGFDANLAAVKWASAQFAPSVGKRIEAAVRLLNFEKAMILAEVVAFVELIMLAVRNLFRPIWKH